ncbi:MAG: phosphoribosylformylglycinamidine synthase subunit PurQ [Treponemataceae bacterium]|nr:phosphoribosylformylglycinamidine synthase subunit PurQ [Treponemataceae bacterium]
MFRIYTERKHGFENEARQIMSEIKGFLGIKGVTGVRYLNRYDIENINEDTAKAAAIRIFSEPQSDICYFEHIPLEENNSIIAWEYLPGQYDQRADSATQCLSILMSGLEASVKQSGSQEKPVVRCAKLVILSGSVTEADVEKIRHYLINPVDSRLAHLDIPQTLKMQTEVPGDIPVFEGFIDLDKAGLSAIRDKMGLAMDMADIEFLQQYFKKEGRNPTETEVRVLDTYWSDHCRHTTFNTVLDDIKIEDGELSEPVKKSLGEYRSMRDELYGERAKNGTKPETLMDMACIGAKYLKKHGKLDDIELSEEINACSIFIDVDVTDTSVTGAKGAGCAKCGAGSSSSGTSEGDSADVSGAKKTEKWLLQFKNETHNHPTEIEPFGGAATCIGGAIRDPLSGRAWVYQSLRVTGAADPTKPIDQTREGKLPQKKLTREAAQGFSSYGNQIGLTTGQVAEIYHPGFEAKRMELGAVIAAVPADVVKREEPEAGDLVVLVGGGTGRDGIGGATGSSKAHNVKSVTTAAAEVQKGNAVEERKIQRLFRNRDVSRMIRRCNDFGAGGVSVAVGELAPGLDINLDAVPKKYEGLNGTELAISESQERMAIVVRAKDADSLIAAAAAENLNAVVIATVTDTNRLVMKWRGKTIVDIDRAFLDTAGASRKAKASISSVKKLESPLCAPLPGVAKILDKASADASCGKDASTATAGDGNPLEEAWLANMREQAVCSQRGLSERFDGSIGSASVLFPMGGKYQSTPESGCAAKIPVLPPYETETTSLMTFGYDPRVASWSPYHGAQTAVLHSLARITAMGGNPENCRLTFQEYFERTASEKAWGKPAAALLGALTAQKEMGTASIGGKDSMSGTFQDLNVPPTLVSFAVTTEKASNITGGAFKDSGSSVYLVQSPYTDSLTPDFASFADNARLLYSLNKKGVINAMYPVAAGGLAEALTKMAFGNKVGCQVDEEFFAGLNNTKTVQQAVLSQNGHDSEKHPCYQLFIPMYGSLLVEVPADKCGDFQQAAGTKAIKLGTTIAEPVIRVKSALIDLAKTENLWEEPLSDVFPPVSTISAEEEKNGRVEKLPAFASEVHPSLVEARKKSYPTGTKARPKVIIPVFPGTNCEYDMARAFILAGADAELFIFRNNTQEALKESLGGLREKIAGTQILALAGGFSAGDEPDGSGKFIANVLREPGIADAVMALKEDRKGLILGICNGFQALVKTGLLPYGKILEPREDMPTLTYNRIGRHISRVVRTRMVSAISPWSWDDTVLKPETHMIPISHGEGRIIMSPEMAEDLFKKGQVFTQYVNEKGLPVMNEPDNPNGSMYAIEGLTSEDGLILGKMGHTERNVGMNLDGSSYDLIKNIGGNKCQNIFAAGIRYFE